MKFDGGCIDVVMDAVMVRGRGGGCEACGGKVLSLLFLSLRFSLIFWFVVFFMLFGFNLKSGFVVFFVLFDFSSFGLWLSAEFFLGLIYGPKLCFS